MDGHSLASRDVADNRFAGDRVAAFGAIDHDVIAALDFDGQVARREGPPRSERRRSAGRLLVGFDLTGRKLAGRGVLQHLPRRKSAEAEPSVEIFDLAVAIFSGDALQFGLGDFSELHAQAAGFFFQVLLADLDRLDPLGGIDDVLDFIARAGSLDDGQPILAGKVIGLGHDLDDVAVAQRVLQRNDAPIDLGSDAGGADVGVNGVGEVDGSSVLRQHHDSAARREGVDFFRVQIHFESGHELARILHILLPLDQVEQPGDELVVVGRPLLALLVFPVRGDAIFGDAVHFLGADLHFERLALRADHGSMQRLIQVGAGNGDEVLDAPGHGTPLVVNHAQGGVAILDRVGDDAQGEQIVNLVHADFLPLHLLVHRVGPLHARFDFGWNALAAQLGFHSLADLVQQLYAGVLLGFETGDHVFVAFGVDIT